jgi:hypothetical protein
VEVYFRSCRAESEPHIIDERAGLGNDRRRDGDCRTCVVYCFRMEVFGRFVTS